ncbi:ArnT family glycosyltransferase [Crateriforma conspicua]|uniref:Glycosyltransferase RgtA/B/C/D-like domain-containing protein n=1 Tax=Crateriforma conspicua TaxID=2527996 RepID=A0A5C5Y2C1_9PLAN|nr:glycosyltransferase family 39 protein [Crateriforma conspicua]TWT69916.1 hypothetical protein Pan14r_22130 [Crateriforma conspicua]
MPIILYTTLQIANVYIASPTVDEPGHLVAGLSHWELGNFDVYRVNPPLPRLVGSLPVWLIGYVPPLDEFTRDQKKRTEFDLGRSYICDSGPDAYWHFVLGRIALIPFGWIGITTTWLWATSLFGRKAAMVSAMLYATSPNLLAHGGLLTPDATATAMGLLAGYRFHRWLSARDMANLFYATVALGTAQLCKHTFLVFYPLMVVLILADSCRRGTHWRSLFSGVAACLALIVGSLFIVNLGYGFEDFGRPLNQYQFVSRLFRGNEVDSTTKWVRDGSQVHPLDKDRHRFSNVPLLSDLRVPLPGNYVRGLDHQQADFESGMNSYSLGRLRDHGWPYFYGLAMGLKTPIGTLLLIPLSLAISPLFRRHADWLPLAFAVAIHVAAATKGGFTMHYRYVLPAIPFVFVFAGRAVTVGGFRSTIAWACFGAAVTGSVLSWPNHLAYFNAFTIGQQKGWFLLDSNLDWGQDLRRLQWWTETEANGSSVYVASFNHFDVAALSGGKLKNLLPDHLVPLGSDSDRYLGSKPRPSDYCAISVNQLRGLGKPIYTCDAKPWVIDPLWLRRVRRLTPVAEVGETYKIYTFQQLHSISQSH